MEKRALQRQGAGDEVPKKVRNFVRSQSRGLQFLIFSAPYDSSLWQLTDRDLKDRIPHAVQCKVLAKEPAAFLRLLMSAALSEKEVGANTLKNKMKRSFAGF